MAQTLSIMIRNPGNTPDLIAAALRGAILQGRLASNQPLRQDQIAEQFGVSKIPVREAMVQLKAEGLIVFVPNRGFVVSELSPAEAEEIYIMRMALETQALERAIPKLRKTDLIRAASVLDISEAEEDRSQWSELNWEFHAALYQAAQMPRLLSTIETLHNNVARYLVIYLGGLSARDASQDEHQKILQACQKKDVDRAVKILKQHLSRASSRLVSFLSKHDQPHQNEVKRWEQNRMKRR
jgi:DNA-binding GntR family transcriptional regulator